jgi:hypothetical protein
MQKTSLWPAGPRIPAASNPIHNVQHRNPDMGMISGNAMAAAPDVRTATMPDVRSDLIDGEKGKR